MKMKEVEVIRVAIDLDLKMPVVLLRDKKEGKKLPIWMELSEARAVALAMERTPSFFPLTCDLARKIIEKFKARVDKVVIDELKNNVYYAKIFIKTDKKILKITAFPSQAIVLALKFKAPIYIDEVKIAAREEPIRDEEIEEFKEKLKEIKPEDFAP